MVTAYLIYLTNVLSQKKQKMGMKMMIDAPKYVVIMM
jgi:hypothetical protein